MTNAPTHSLPVEPAATELKVQGGCHCGAIRFEAIVDPTRLVICHCTDCQRLTGTAYRVSVSAARDRFRLMRGQPKIYVKTGDSGARRVQAFCAECGSPLYTHGIDEADRLGLRVGAIDQRNDLAPPTKQIWHRSALPWAMILTGVPAVERE